MESTNSLNITKAFLHPTGHISLIYFQIANSLASNPISSIRTTTTDISEDDDSALGLAPGIGEITLDVKEVLVQGHVPWAKTPVILPPLHIHERAKKGIVHGTQ